MLLSSQAHVANKVRCLARAKGRQKYDKRGGLAIEEGLFRQRDWQEAEKPEIPPTLSCPAACCSLRDSSSSVAYICCYQIRDLEILPEVQDQEHIQLCAAAPIQQTPLTEN